MAQNIKDMIKTSSKVVPMIYAYTTPGIVYHDGYIKIGYTEQDVDTRIYQQTHTAGVKPKKEWQGTALFDDGSGDSFTDHDFHAYLRKNGVMSLAVGGGLGVLLRNSPAPGQRPYATKCPLSILTFAGFKSP